MRDKPLTIEEYRALTRGATVLSIQPRTTDHAIDRHRGPAPDGPNKYGARKTEYNGRRYDSALEARHAQNLDLQVKAGLIKSYEPQVHFQLHVAGKLITTYRPDFLLTRTDGSQEIHECKGRPARDWAMRKKLFEALHPDIPITVITKIKPL